MAGLSLLRVGSTFGLLLLLSAAAVADDGGRFSVADQFSIGVAGEGYAWHTVHKLDAEAKDAGTYLCSAREATGQVILVVEPRTASTDAARAAVLKAHFNSLLTELEKAGFTNFHGLRPVLTAPVPDDNEYSVTCDSPAGEKRYFYAHTVFGNNVYMVQATGASSAESERLAGVAKTLKEEGSHSSRAPARP